LPQNYEPSTARPAQANPGQLHAALRVDFAGRTLRLAAQKKSEVASKKKK